MNLPLRSPLGPPPPHPIRTAILAQRPLIRAALLFSSVSGLLMLVPQWYMFEVYGRVLNSRSESTLLWLLLMTIGAWVVIELLDLVRTRILRRAARAVDQSLSERLFDLTVEANLRKLPGGSPQTFADLKALREGLGSPVVGAVIDLPAAALLLACLFSFHPLLGVLTLVGALLQSALVWATERRTMPLLSEAMRSSIQANAYASSVLRNVQVVEALGMLPSIRKRWLGRQRAFVAQQARASDHAGTHSSAAKLLQTMQGSILLGAACWLVLDNRLWGGAGMMIVASILGGRVLAPMAQMVTHWRSAVTARDAAKRLTALFALFGERDPAMPLPAPKGLLTVEGVVAAAPGTTAPVIRGVSFAARPGELVLVTGPSASGKTCLARLLVGLWPTTNGKVRLDGVDVHGWNKAELGPHVGYLPQTIELFDGTVAENVARFGPIDLDKVREALDRVGLAEAVAELPHGLETRIGADGAILSGGQRQRLALARAIYGTPSYLVLDEPNSSLDEAGERQLIALLQDLKARGSTLIVIAHRSSLLAVADKLLIINEGQTVAFGPRDEVLAAMKKANEQARAQLASRAAQDRLQMTTGATA